MQAAKQNSCIEQSLKAVPSKGPTYCCCGTWCRQLVQAQQISWVRCIAHVRRPSCNIVHTCCCCTSCEACTCRSCRSQSASHHMHNYKQYLPHAQLIWHQPCSVAACHAQVGAECAPISQSDRQRVALRHTTEQPGLCGHLRGHKRRIVGAVVSGCLAGHS